MRETRPAVVITHGYHPPWNIGEFIATKYFVEAISLLFENIYIISTIDNYRLKVLQQYNISDFWRLNKKNNLYLFRKTEDGIKVFFDLLSDKDTFIFIINTSYLPLVKFYRIFKKMNSIPHKIFYVSYGAENLRLFPRIRHYIGHWFFNNFMKTTTILTVSPIEYRKLKTIGLRRVHYVPMPLSSKIINMQRKNINTDVNSIKILYMGHINLTRFPYPIILRVIKNVSKKLKDIDIKFNIYVPPIPWHYYGEKIEYVNKVVNLIEKLSLDKIVSITVRNLNESEKIKVLSNSHIFLFPALRPKAMDPPLSILEAMATKNCVIATDVQSVPILLGNGLRGVICTRTHLYEDLLFHLHRLLRNYNEIEQYSTKARNFIIRNHSPRTVANVIELLLKPWT